MASAASASDFRTVPAFQADFSKAKACHEIDGRKVWKGSKAFYIEASSLSEGAVSVVIRSENAKQAFTKFETACR